MHPIIAADITKRGHDLAWYQQHYGAAHLGHAGQELFVIAVIALAVIVVVAVVRRAVR